MLITNKLPYPKNIAFSLGEKDYFTCSDEQLETLLKEELTSKEQWAVTLFFKNRMSYVTAGKVMKYSASYVREIIHKAIVKLSHPKNKVRLFPAKPKFLVKLYITSESKLAREVYARNSEEAKKSVCEGFYKGLYDDDIKLVTENITELLVEEVEK